jgi:hypothetical protein
MVGVAILLIGTRVVGVVQNIHEGWLRMLGFYSITGEQALGYDLEKLAELAFITWVAYRMIRQVSG